MLPMLSTFGEFVKKPGAETTWQKTIVINLWKLNFQLRLFHQLVNNIIFTCQLLKCTSPACKSESEQVISRTSKWLTTVSLEYKCYCWHLYNLPSTPRRPTHLPTLRNFSFANRLQWYKVTWFVDSFEHISCLVAGTNYHFPASRGNLTQATSMSGNWLNYQTTLSW